MIIWRTLPGNGGHATVGRRGLVPGSSPSHFAGGAMPDWMLNDLAEGARHFSQRSRSLPVY